MSSVRPGVPNTWAAGHHRWSSPAMMSKGLWSLTQQLRLVFRGRLQLLAGAGAVGGGALVGAAAATAAEHGAERLPVEKLACRRSPSGGPVAAERQPVVLLGCGSFNPPTLMHLRMFEAARGALTQEGYDVLGGYLSPVNDMYGKAGLAPSLHRIEMCDAAVASSDWLMVTSWEAQAAEYQRTLPVLQYVQAELQELVPQGHGGKLVRVMLLCGSDMLETFAVPNVWSAEHMTRIFAEHGVVAVMRPGAKVPELLSDEASVLAQNKQHIVLVHDVVDNPISSTAVRKAVHQGQSIKYLVPDEVARYIQANRLYV